MPRMPKSASTTSEDTVTFKKSHFYSALVVLAFAAGVLVGFFAWGRNPVIMAAPQATALPQAVPTTIQFTPTVDPAALEKIMDQAVEQTRHFKGDENAPITMVEFADYQCPFCGRHFQQTQPQIDQTYLDAGQLRFGYINMAFLGQESIWAAEAAECAADQDKFWEYHDYLYNHQAGENQGAFNKDNLKQFAADLGLDATAFNDCLDTGKYTQLVQQDTQGAQSLGFRSTPSFLINGQTVVGAQPLTAFQQVIDPLIKQ